MCFLLNYVKYHSFNIVKLIKLYITFNVISLKLHDHARFNRGKKGISTFMAVLLLIILAIVAGVLIYAYSMGYFWGNPIGGGGNKAMQIQSVAQDSYNIWLYVKNSGSGVLKLGPSTNARSYVNSVSKPYLIKEPAYVTGLPESQTCTVSISLYDLDSGWFGKTCTFKVVADDGTFATIDYKVTGTPPAYHKIHVSFNSVGGTVTPAGPTVDVRDMGSQSFTFGPKAGYAIADVKVDSASIGAPSSYSFTNVVSDRYLDVVFKPVYTITSTFGLYGKIAPTPSVQVIEGGSQTFTITADLTYRILDVLVDGYSVGTPAVYTFSNVDENHRIEASFTSGTAHIITPTAGLGANILPSTAVSVPDHGSQTFTIWASTGYHLTSIIVDDVNPQPIVGQYTFTNVETDHKIDVTAEPNTYTITASAGAGGTIDPSGSIPVSHGTDKTFTITPNSGYYVSELRVDGINIGRLGSYTFTQITASHTIEAVFAQGTAYIITSTAGVGGTISPLGPVYVVEGNSQTFTITPNGGYLIEDVKIDGSSIGAVPSYTYSNVQTNHQISATFRVNPLSHIITASAGPNGRITPSGQVSVVDGGSATFLIDSYVDYRVAAVLVDGINVGAVGSYTFSNVITDHAIIASFEPGVAHTIISSAGAGGTITPLGIVYVPHLGSQTFTITHDTGYHVADVIVDGASVGARASFTFSSVTADRTISAQFALDSITHIITVTQPTSGGTITPAGDSNRRVYVPDGGSQTFTIQPTTNPPYHVVNVIVDGNPVGAYTSWTFSNVVVDHTITATLAPGAAYTITATAGVGGTISPSGQVSVLSGATPSFTIAPNTGYHILDVKVDGVSQGPVTSYVFPPVTASHTIEAFFEINLYKITASAGPHGGINPSGTINVAYGGSVYFTITAASGYHIDDVLVDGVTAGRVGSYQFTNIDSDHTVSATFAIGTAFTITSSAGTGGTITPLGAVTVLEHGSQRFDIAPNTGYHILDVKVDGVSKGPINTYTFTDVIQDGTISADFAINTYTLTIIISPLDGGEVEKYPDLSQYTHGSTVMLIVTPSAGHIFQGWSGAGLSGNANPLTITMDGDKTITATFAETTGDTTLVYRRVPQTGMVGVLYTAEGALFGPWQSEPIRVIFTRPDNTKIITTKSTSLRWFIIFPYWGFDASYAPDASGWWRVDAEFLGDGQWGASNTYSFTNSTFYVPKAVSEITCNVSPTSAAPGQTITISGDINPSRPGSTVTLRFTKPDASTFTVTTVTDSSSHYTYPLTSTELGQWSVVASWLGDPAYEGDSSPTRLFNIANPVNVIITSSPEGSGFISVDGTAITTPQTFSWIPGTIHTLTAIQYKTISTDSRYSWASWSDTGALSHSYMVNSPATVTATYNTQYQVTFTRGNLDSSSTGTVVTIVDGSTTTRTYSQLGSSGYQVWLNSGATYTYADPASSSTTGRRFDLTSVSGPASPIAGAGTITPTYQVQYRLIMAANAGTTTPAVGETWYNSGLPVTITATPPSTVPGERYNWNGWTGSGIGSYSGPNNPQTITMNDAISETASWTHQYQATFASNPPEGGTTTPSGTQWVNAGNIAISATANPGYAFTSWTASGPITVVNPTTASINGPGGTLTAQFTRSVSYLSAGSGSASTTNPTPGYPTLLQSGDLILLQVVVTDSSTNPTTPTGFTLLYGPDQSGTSDNDYKVRQFIYYKFSAGTETGTITVTIGGTQAKLARMYAFRGVVATSFYEGGNWSFNYDDIINPPSVTAASVNRLAVAFVCVSNDVSLGSFTGETGGNWVEAVDEFMTSLGYDGCIQLQTATLTSTTISGGAYDMGSTSERWGVRAFALIPQP